MSRPEAHSNKLNPEKLIQGWRERCGEHWRGDSGTYYSEWQAEGEDKITRLLRQYGEEAASRILAGIEGLSLTTQLYLLRLGQTKDAPHLITVLETVYPPEERGKRKYESDFSLQEDHLYQIEEAILKLKFPDEDTAGFVALLPPPKKTSLLSPRIEALELAREKGPDYMLIAFEFIPLEQISRRNFEKRLEVERRLREKPEPKVEREIRVTGKVQGVYFRNFCKERAWIWGITGGWARNEWDGSVTVLIQGPPSILEAFLDEEDFKNHARAGEIRRRVETIEILEDREITKELTDFREFSPSLSSGINFLRRRIRGR